MTSSTCLPGSPTAHPWLAPTGTDGVRANFPVRLDAATDWVLDEHRVAGRPTLPITALLELVRAAAVACRPAGIDVGPDADTATEPDPVLELRSVRFPVAVSVPEGSAVHLDVMVTQDGGRQVVQIIGSDGDPPAVHAGAVAASAVAAWVPGDRPEPLDLAALSGRCRVRRDPDAEPADDRAPMLGPRWSSLGPVWAAEPAGQGSAGKVGAAEAYAELRARHLVAAELCSFELHPALLDEALTFATGPLTAPVGIGRVQVRGPLPARLVSWVRRRPGRPGVLDVVLADPGGAELVRLDAVTVGSAPPAAQPRSDGAPPIGTSLPTGGALLESPRRHLEDLDLERSLAEIWSRALGVDGIDRDEDFFALGGSSLVAVEVIWEASDVLGVAIPVTTLFDAPTLAEFAAEVDRIREFGSPDVDDAVITIQPRGA